MLDYNYLKEHYEMIAIDFTRQQELESDPNAIQINFTGYLENQSAMFLHYWRG